MNVCTYMFLSKYFQGAAENAAEAWRSLSQSAAAAAAAAWSYDPTSLGSYPYGTP